MVGAFATHSNPLIDRATYPEAGAAESCGYQVHVQEVLQALKVAAIDRFGGSSGPRGCDSDVRPFWRELRRGQITGGEWSRSSP